jgi:hypothetical protein
MICELQLKDEEGVMYDSTYDLQLRNDILKIITNRQTIKSKQNKLIGSCSSKFSRRFDVKQPIMESRVLKGEQSNTSILYEDSFFFKLYRRLESGINPDAEISRCLTENTAFSNNLNIVWTAPSFLVLLFYTRQINEVFKLIYISLLVLLILSWNIIPQDFSTTFIPWILTLIVVLLLDLKWFAPILMNSRNLFRTMLVKLVK